MKGKYLPNKYKQKESRDGNLNSRQGRIQSQKHLTEQKLAQGMILMKIKESQAAMHLIL